MKKILSVLILGILILSGIQAVAFPFGNIKTDANGLENKTNIVSLDDELDQYQTEIETVGVIGNNPFPPYFNSSIAQSFTPQKAVLTRIQIRIARNESTTYPYILVIREYLTGENLAVASVDADDIPVVEDIPDFEWIEFDFDDLPVTINQTYFMISYTANESDNFYGWGADRNNLYPNGVVFVSNDDGETWENVSYADMCFMTYGRDNQPPTAPNIKGQTSGKTGKEYEYTITGSDPDGDDLFVIIDWGDNTSSELLGPYDGSYEITKKHTWEEKGNYTIKAAAKDPYGWGPEGKLEITMPKTKMFYYNFNLLSWLLERFPNAFLTLRYLFGI